MFVLIQRGQSFVDACNYPVEICKVTLTQVIYRRLDGRTRVTSIGAFNEEFERIEHNELHMIKAEIEKERHITHLRQIRRTPVN
ncbi:DUF4222 domain-containing protein [Escherichia coli]|nr:DUF4222 domain-containing protein [Escherichia coli]